jgi:Terpene synthase family 2, C-terminal metal binding
MVFLSYPFPLRINPELVHSRDHTLAWAEEMKLFTRTSVRHHVERGLYWNLMAYVYPDLDLAGLDLINAWNLWGFLLDDFGDDGDLGRDPSHAKKMFNDLLAVFDGEKIPGPLFVALDDLWQRMKERSTLQWQYRFRRILARCFETYIWEARNRANKYTPDHQTYIVNRRWTSGWYTHCCLTEILENAYLPANLRYNEMVSAFCTSANNVICWANDLLSWRKEQTVGDVHNLVLIVQHEQHCSIEDAIDKVLQLHNREVELCQKIHQNIPSFDPYFDAAINRITAFGINFIIGNVVWAKESHRYDQRGNEHADDRSYVDHALIRESRNIDYTDLNDTGFECPG